MKTVLRLVLLAALVAAGVWLWTVLFPGPQKVIRQRFAALARAVSSTGNESDLARLAAARAVAGFFAPQVELNVQLREIDRRTSIDRDEITQAIAFARSRAGAVRVRFPDVNVTVAPDRQSAVADVTLEARLPGEADPILQEMKFTLVKTDGQWLITRAETVRVLS